MTAARQRCRLILSAGALSPGVLLADMMADKILFAGARLPDAYGQAANRLGETFMAFHRVKGVKKGSASMKAEAQGWARGKHTKGQCA